jgi:hypothetical protein
MTQRLPICRKQEIVRTIHSLFDHKNVDWDPEEQHTSLGKGFIVPLFNKDILLHDYHLHWNNTTTIRNYQLQNFLQTGGIELPCGDSKHSGNLFGSD